MTITTFDTKKLKLPRDVNRPDEILIHGELTGANNEVVVIMQLERSIFEQAYVCHKTLDECGAEGIYDLPGFKFLEPTPFTQKRIDGINFTMACKAESGWHRSRSNWLW